MLRYFLTLNIIIAAPAFAANSVVCEYIGQTDGRGSPELYVGDVESAFSYTSYNGLRQVLPVSCATFSSEDGNGVVCSRIHSRSDGIFTTDHYLIAKLSRITSLLITTVVEGDETSPYEHRAHFEQYMMSCETARSP